MHNSAYKLGLFLMISLVILSTVAAGIPRANMNLFSDAMASPSPASPPGATGTTGPQGTQGIQGLQGFSGLGVINETKLYYTIGNMAQSNLTNTGSSQAVCDLGIPQVILQ